VVSPWNGVHTTAVTNPIRCPRAVPFVRSAFRRALHHVPRCDECVRETVDDICTYSYLRWSA